MTDSLPPKPFRRIETWCKITNKWRTAPGCAFVSKGFAEGYVHHYLGFYPCPGIRVLNWKGDYDLVHPGNGEVRVN